MAIRREVRRRVSWRSGQADDGGLAALVKAPLTATGAANRTDLNRYPRFRCLPGRFLTRNISSPAIKPTIAAIAYLNTKSCHPSPDICNYLTGKASEDVTSVQGLFMARIVAMASRTTLCASPPISNAATWPPLKFCLAFQ